MDMILLPVSGPTWASARTRRLHWLPSTPVVSKSVRRPRQRGFIASAETIDRHLDAKPRLRVLRF